MEINLCNKLVETKKDNQHRYIFLSPHEVHDKYYNLS
jgi:hypothetical protein